MQEIVQRELHRWWHWRCPRVESRPVIPIVDGRSWSCYCLDSTSMWSMCNAHQRSAYWDMRRSHTYQTMFLLCRNVRKFIFSPFSKKPRHVEISDDIHSRTSASSRHLDSRSHIAQQNWTHKSLHQQFFSHSWQNLFFTIFTNWWNLHE